MLNYNKKSHGVLNIEELYKNKIPPEKGIKEKMTAPATSKSDEPYETDSKPKLPQPKTSDNIQMSLFEKAAMMG